MRGNVGARMKLSVWGDECRKENNKQGDGGQGKGNMALRDGVALVTSGGHSSSYD
jgi:hypothetical protein